MNLVIPKGVEPLIFWMRTRRPGPLDDGTKSNIIITTPLSFVKYLCTCYTEIMKKVKCYWRLIFPIFFIILIWCFSSKSGEASDGQSLGWADFLGLPNAVTRKLAHLFLFGCLGYSFSSYFKGLAPNLYPTKFYFWAAICASAVYAAIDEFHQIVVPGRSAEITDIIIDTVGAAIGTLAYVAIFCFFRLWKAKRFAK